MRTIVPNLWINDGRIDEAVQFWVSTFPDSRVVSSSRYGEGAGRWAGAFRASSPSLRAASARFAAEAAVPGYFVSPMAPRPCAERTPS